MGNVCLSSNFSSYSGYFDSEFECEQALQTWSSARKLCFQVFKTEPEEKLYNIEVLGCPNPFDFLSALCRE